MSRIWATSLVLMVSGCVNTPVDPAERYLGPVPACQAGERTSPLHANPNRLHQADEPWNPGPYAAWNTHPDLPCNDNPIIPVAGKQRVLAVTGDDAELERRNVELYVTYPAASDPSFTGIDDVASGRFPLVVFAHANHDQQCDIFEGYYSLHDHWASWGFIVAAVDGTALNCDPGSRQNIDLRAQGQVAALELLHELDQDPRSRFFGHVDTSRVFFAGHSRGGGASFVAAKRVPQTLGVITLQGIDLTAFGFGSAALTELPVLGMTAGLDVDLHYPRVEPTEDQLSGPYTWVNINGGIHAYTGDSSPLEFDDRPGITRQNQHDLTELYTTAFLLDTVGAESSGSFLRTHDGSVAARALSAKGVYQRWMADVGTVWVDRFNDEDETMNDLGGANESEGFLVSADVATYRPESEEPEGRWAKSHARQLRSAGAATFETRLDVDGSLAVTATPRLVFRAKGPDYGVVAPLRVTFVGPAGEDTVAIAEQHRGPLPIGSRYQQVEIDIPQRHTELHALRFEIGGGTLFIDDLRFVARGN